MRILGFLFVLSAACVCIFAFSRARWEATLAAGDGISIIDLPRSPAWNPPAIPGRDVFASTFPDTPRSNSAVERRLLLGWTFLDAALYLWPVTAAFGILYVIIRRGRRDPLLHGALCTGAAFTGAAIVCVALWLAFGGWGPPSPELFAGLALIVGIIISLTTYEPKRA